jgi:hypothetical protein
MKLPGPSDQPIGYWVKLLHGLLEARIGLALKEVGLRRRDRQVLNLLSDVAQTRATVEGRLRAFFAVTMPTEPSSLDEVLDGSDGLIGRGLVTYDSETDVLALTEEGKSLFIASRAPIQEAFDSALYGVTDEEYLNTVRVLALVVKNIRADLPENVMA